MKEYSLSTNVHMNTSRICIEERRGNRESTNEKTVVSFSPSELVIVANALNEICNSLIVPVFETRIAHSLEEVKKLLNQVHSAVKS